MVVREVGEDATRKLQASDTLLHHRVRRHLHKAVVATLVHHLAQHCVEANGVGCGVCRCNLSLAHAIYHGRNQSRLVTQQLKKVTEQRGNGCLAVCASHAHQLQLLRGVVVEGGSHICHSLVAILHHYVAHSLVQLLWQCLTHHRHRSAFDGRGDVVVTVGLCTTHRKEAVARLNLA